MLGNKNSQGPIGFFDSGVGGTSVWSEVVALLPNEDTIYLADSANAPYGNKSSEVITQLSIKNTEFLLAQGCKMIAVPCNTATTNSIAHLRANYDVPFIGIEPAIKPAALKSSTKKIGVLATKGTLSSALFHETSALYADKVETVEIIGTGIVELIEAGKIGSKQMHRLLLKLTKPFIESGIDYLVLGCSHYPYIKTHLERLLPDNVTIIDSGVAVARQTLQLLKQHNLVNPKKTPGSHELYSNLDIEVLDALTSHVSQRNVQLTDF